MGGPSRQIMAAASHPHTIFCGVVKKQIQKRNSYISYKKVIIFSEFSVFVRFTSLLLMNIFQFCQLHLKETGNGNKKWRFLFFLKKIAVFKKIMNIMNNEKKVINFSKSCDGEIPVNQMRIQSEGEDRLPELWSPDVRLPELWSPDVRSDVEWGHRPEPCQSNFTCKWFFPTMYSRMYS